MTLDESPTRQRRRPILLAVGIVLVLVAALASYISFSSLANTEAVLVVTSSVAKGEPIQSSQLGSLEIVGGQSTGAIPATDAHLVTGQFAATDLVPGSLLTRDSVVTSLPVEAGASVVGLALSTGQLPSTQLHAGDRIRIVSTPISQSEPPSESPPTISATVFSVHDDERTGLTIVDVIIPSGVAADVAARAATGRVALILDSSSEV